MTSEEFEKLKTFIIKKPKADYIINFPPHYKQQIIKGKLVENIPELFKGTLKTEGII